MKLIPVDEWEGAVDRLWVLLNERPASSNISHRAMPEWADHAAFVRNHPYAAWYIIDNEGMGVGSIYLSKPGGPSVLGNEIGIDIAEEWRDKGYGRAAVKLLMQMHGDRRYVANCAPGNEASQALFKSLGFKLVQHTYALEAE